MNSPMRPWTAPQQPLSSGYLLLETTTLAYEPTIRSVPRTPCVHAALAHQGELMPALIDLAALDIQTQAELTQLACETQDGQPPVVCAWIESLADTQTLAEHIARYLVGPNAAGQTVFWRYYDPRVFSLALAVLTDQQRNALLGPATAWRFIWAGYHWQVSGPGEAAPALDGYTPAWPQPNQWSRIDRSELVTRIIWQLEPMSREQAAQLPSSIDRILTQGVEQAGLAEPDQLVDYALHCLQYGRAFAQHPKLADVWPALAKKQMDWADAKARLSPTDYQALGAQASLYLA
jgi:hypothetical protein